jgi:hypothetical protein
MPEQEKAKVIQSIKDLNFDGPDLELDLSDDAWSYGAPPPAGVYDFKWFLAKDGITVGYTEKDNPKTAYVRIGCEGHLKNNADWEDSIAYMYLDSRVFRGKSNSTMAGFIQKAGGEKYITKPISTKKIAGLAEAILKKEPIIKAEIDWQGQYDWTPDKGKNAGEKTYERVYRHMTDFPVDPQDKNKRLHIVTVTGKDGLPKEIRAQIQVVRLFGKGEALPAPKLVSQPRHVAAPQLAEEVELEEITPTPTIAKVNSKEDEDSMELMLA